ncbi:hypothetical protein CYG49_02900 [Candidatus Saccharibacteria bacterium]|nr:MAG: hypothetical protein CYG49_02900 [Candidatus Saccharibacteria bacterium]
MSLFDILIVQPIFNVLMLIYGLLPGSDFGIAVIIFTILVRLLMWPLIRKQLHHTKLIRDLAPELKRIKERAKGNKQLQAQMQLELYREKGVSPFGSLGLLFVQLPIYIALFRVITIVTSERDKIAQFTYQPVESLAAVRALIANPAGFNETLLNVINLAERALAQNAVIIPLVLLSIVAAILQYIQSRQITPKPEDGRRLRDILKEQAEGKDVDQTEISTVISHNMITILPLITLVVMLYLPGALVLYTVVSSLVAVIQQHLLLKEDEQEMSEVSGSSKAKKASATKGQKAETRAKKAEVAEIVQQSVEAESQPVVIVKKKQTQKKRKRR